MTRHARLAIFVGGGSTRMGRPKGLLSTPGGGPPIVARLIDIGGKADLHPFFVGDSRAYQALPSAAETPRVDDDPADAGPLGGLRAALRFAQAHGGTHVVSVACDMPFVTVEVLRALRDEESLAPVVAPRRHADAPWEPMLARYQAASVLPVLERSLLAGDRSFQRLFARLEVDPLEATASVLRALDDWDTPHDVVP